MLKVMKKFTFLSIILACKPNLLGKRKNLCFVKSSVLNINKIYTRNKTYKCNLNTDLKQRMWKNVRFKLQRTKKFIETLTGLGIFTRTYPDS